MGNQMTLYAETAGQGGECPIQGMSECPSNAQDQGGEVDPRNMMPPPNQRPAPNQPFPLPIERQKSTIPKAGTEDTWVYPSQQMFFNALLRKGEKSDSDDLELIFNCKGWEFGPEDIKSEDMEHIIKIHNANNESAWQEVSQRGGRGTASKVELRYKESLRVTESLRLIVMRLKLFCCCC